MSVNPNRTLPENVFVDFIHEDVAFCDIEDVLGGITEIGIYYCFQPFISSMKVPTTVSSNQYAGTIKSISCLEHRGFQKIKQLIETADFKTTYNGTSDTSLLNFFVLGNRAELIGLSRKLREKPFTLVVVDNNSRKFVIGTLESAAYLKSFEIQSGKKVEDDCGATIQFSSNAIFYELTGSIPIAEPNSIGDFNDDFDDDFD